MDMDDSVCLHCERRPAAGPLGLCAVCDARSCVRVLYAVRRRGWTPAWEAHLRRLTDLGVGATGLSEATARWLASSPSLRHVTRLRCHGNPKDGGRPGGLVVQVLQDRWGNHVEFD